MKNARHAFIGAAYFCTSLAAGLATSAAKITNISLDCTEITSGDIILMRAHFADKTEAKTFAVTFQAEPDFGTDREVTVVVAGVPIGALMSQVIVGGYVGGEMSFSDPVVPFTQTKGFPSDFPSAVKRNAQVSLTAGGKTLVSCRLE